MGRTFLYLDELEVERVSNWTSRPSPVSVLDGGMTFERDIFPITCHLSCQISFNEMGKLRDITSKINVTRK